MSMTLDKIYGVAVFFRVFRVDPIDVLKLTSIISRFRLSILFLYNPVYSLCILYTHMVSQWDLTIDDLLVGLKEVV